MYTWFNFAQILFDAAIVYGFVRIQLSVWDMLVTKDFKGDPCVYENITGKFYYWENNNEK